MPTPEWYEDFFAGMAVDLWTKVTTPEMTEGEAQFFAEELRLAPGRRVLDVPCGDGRHSIALAARGCHVTGVDISADFLSRARDAAARRLLTVNWIHGDMRRLPAGPFDAALCFGNSFGYLHHEGTIEFLCNLRNVLEPGTRFLLETGMAAESLLPVFQPRSEYTVGDIRMVTERSYRVEDSRMSAVYTFEQDGRTESHPMEQSIYTCAEIRRMLAGAGFEVLSMYGDTSRVPFNLGARHLILVSERR